MNLVEKIQLPNDLVVEIWDKSRAIAADTMLVGVVIKTTVQLKEEYFSDPEHFIQVKKVFGPEICYEYVKERSFVGKGEKGEVFRELLEVYKKDSLPYIAKPNFPARFALSKLREIQEKYYKYEHLFAE